MRRVLMLIVLLGVLVTAQAQTEDDIPPVNVRLVTSIENMGSRLEIWEDGELVPLAEDFDLPISEGFFVEWSPDCSRLLFTADGAPESLGGAVFGMFMYDFTTEEYSRLVPTDVQYPLAPVWSPDGERVYFMEFRDGARVSYVMNMDDRSYTEFQLPFYSFSGVSWAEDSNSFAIVTFESGRNDIYLVDLKNDTPTWTSVFSQDTFIYGLDLIAGGSEIIFVHGSRDNSNVYHLNLLDQAINRLTPEPAMRSFVNVSPDERTVAFTSNTEVLVINIDGTGERNLTNGQYSGMSSARILGWTGDGNYIVFDGSAVDTTLLHQVFAVSADGSEFIQLTNLPFVERFNNTWWACFPEEES